ncbi:Adaptive-response sensory-kinase SasA [subsurface metagenome]
MIYTTKFKLISSFIGMCILVGGLSVLVGGQLIYRTVLSEATNRIRLDLNAAREIYNNLETRINVGLSVAKLETVFRSALKRRDIPPVVRRLEAVADEINLDFAGIVTADGKTLYRIGLPPENNQNDGHDDHKINPAAGLALERKALVSGTVILDRQILLAENPGLAEQAKINLLPTPRAAPRPEREETAGMAIVSAVPMFDGSQLTGILYGGILLNRSKEIVDRVRETVFKQEIYKGQSIGTATIFFKDLRISTNVLTPDGNRAIGTRVSREVKEKVLVEGELWTDRAFVVNDWYITAYEPIEDIFAQRVGMLYVGVLESKYADVQRHALMVFILITAVAIVLAIALGYILGQRILKPVQQLISVSDKVSKGDLSPKIGPISRSEIGVLQKTFMQMLSSLRERDRQQKAESEHKLQRSEKQASVGRLAAGVAHEINNPLTGVLTFTHMLLRRKDINDEIRADLKTIAQSTERVRQIVKGLLDFSRQTRIEPERIDINKLIRDTISLVENQALVKGVRFCFDPGDDLPERTLDRNQFQSVLLNIIVNAIDATEPGGHIDLSTNLSISTDKINQKGIEIVISDTGCGIPSENLDKLFDPFFTTKEVGEGTGLGLSVSMGIIEKHGGTIRVRSKPGRGSTFLIWLPIEENTV